MREKLFSLDGSNKDYLSFKRKNYENKKGVNQSLRSVIDDMNTDSSSTLIIFFLCLITREDHHWKAQLDSKGQDLNK